MALTATVVGESTLVRVLSGRATKETAVFRSGFPIVSTPDMERSLRFYRDLLGGEVFYQFPDDGSPGYVAIRVGSMQLGIGLSPDTEADSPGQRISLWMYVDDCDAAIAHLQRAGVRIVEEPHDQPWGERMSRVLDPDGNEVIVARAAE